VNDEGQPAAELSIDMTTGVLRLDYTMGPILPIAPLPDEPAAQIGVGGTEIAILGYESVAIDVHGRGRHASGRGRGCHRARGAERVEGVFAVDSRVMGYAVGPTPTNAPKSA
jgi:hypothetical protein